MECTSCESSETKHMGVNKQGYDAGWHCANCGTHFRVFEDDYDRTQYTANLSIVESEWCSMLRYWMNQYRQLETKISVVHELADEIHVCVDSMYTEKNGTRLPKELSKFGGLLSVALKDATILKSI